MFKQFISNFLESQAYLITSLWLFLVFFIVVAVLLYRTNKTYTDYMSKLPLEEDEK